VNASLFDRARAERFAQLMDEASGARRHHAHSKLDSELAELVNSGRRLKSMRLNGHPTESFKRDLRAQLIATAQRDGIGITAAPEPQTRRGIRLPGARPRARGAIVIGVAAGTLALSGVSVASGEAIPGDALYGMKRSTERAQLALAGSDLGRGQLHLEFARTRLHEADVIWSDEAGFVRSLRDMDLETQAGIRMLITSAMSQNDTRALDAIDSFVIAQRMDVGDLLDRSGNTARQQVTESLKLLTEVAERAKAARSALACGAQTIGSDLLGPIVAACSAPKAQTQPPRAGEPAGQPQHAPAAGQPSPATQPVASATPTPDPEAQKKDDGLLGELGRILGGILG
jgi:hypothetical protein